MKKDSWFATLDESTDSLMQEAQELFRLVEAHNEQAIDEVKRGLKQEASWRYAGLIFLDATTELYILVIKNYYNKSPTRGDFLNAYT